MDYEFPLPKPLPQRDEPDYSIEPSAEQRALVHWITAQMLRILEDYRSFTEYISFDARQPPFHLYELSDEMCRLLGIEPGCVALLDLLEVEPKLVWSDVDLAILRRLSIDQLRVTCRELATFRPRPNSFSCLTAAY